MTDIVERLRAPAYWFSGSSEGHEGENNAPYEAAARIEQLETALLNAAQEAENHHAENVSRAALGGSDMAQRKAKAIVSRSGVLLNTIKSIARAALEGK